jgi:hypothetical protein
MRSKAVCDEVYEAASICQRHTYLARGMTRDLLSTELLEQFFQLSRHRQLDETFH